MSNIFQPFVRSTFGAIPINVGVGPIVDPIASQGLNINSDGEIHVVADATINHYHQGLPFDENGRLSLTLDPKVRVDQGIPFAANGSVSVGTGIGYIDQGLAYTVEGGIAAVGDSPVTLWTIEDGGGGIFGYVELTDTGDLVPRGNIEALYVVNPANDIFLELDAGSVVGGFVEVNAIGLTVTLFWVDADQSYQGNDQVFAAAIEASVNATVPVSGIHFPETPPIITDSPVDLEVNEGQEATFNSAADNFDTVQWFENGAEFTGETDPTLTFDTVLGDDTNTYFARYTNIAGDTDTLTATLTVNQIPPIIILQPFSQTLEDGEVVDFLTNASGFDTVQWYEEGVLMPGEEGVDLSFTVSLAEDGFGYFARYTNPAGDTDTNTAILTVGAETFAELQLLGTSSAGNVSYPFTDTQGFQAGDYIQIDFKMNIPTPGGSTYSVIFGQGAHTGNALRLFDTSGATMSYVNNFGEPSEQLDFTGGLNMWDQEWHTVRIEFNGTNYEITVDETTANQNPIVGQNINQIRSSSSPDATFSPMSVRNLEVLNQGILTIDIPINEGVGDVLANSGTGDDGAINGVVDVNWQWVGLSNLYVNPELSGGTEDPGATPPTAHTINSGTGGVVSITPLIGGFFEWNMNSAGGNTNKWLEYDLAANNPDLVIGNDYRFSLTARNANSAGNNFRVLNMDGITGITIINESPLIPGGSTDEVFVEFTVDGVYSGPIEFGTLTGGQGFGDNFLSLPVLEEFTPPVNLYVNPEFAGGTDGIRGDISALPPTDHTWAVTDPTEDTPSVEFLPGGEILLNDENLLGRRNLIYSVSDNNFGDIVEGNLYRIEFTVENDPLSNEARPVVFGIQSQSGSVDIINEQLNVPVGNTEVVFYEFVITDSSWAFDVTVGTSVVTLAGEQTKVTISNPGLFDLGAAP